MKRNWIVRKLGEALRGAVEASTEHQHGHASGDAGLAMLIDMENVAPGHMEEIMAQAKRFGTVVHRSGFGAATDKKWTEARRKHGVLCGRQSHVNAGKNSADMELAIAAMDLLGDRRITGFCIVSSDSDFTPVVMRLREAGRLVLGFGEKKAPSPFIEACDHFETIGKVDQARTTGDKSAKKPVAQLTTMPNAGGLSQAVPVVTAPNGKSRVNGNARTEFLELVKTAAAKAKQHDGWIHTSVVGSQIRKIKPKIRYKDYGHKTLIGILETYPDDIETRGTKERKQIRLRG